MNVIERLEKLAAAGLVDHTTYQALPDLLKLARAADALACFDCEALHEDSVPLTPDGRCAFCALREAREPLFREVPS